MGHIRRPLSGNEDPWTVASAAGPLAASASSFPEKKKEKVEPESTGNSAFSGLTSDKQSKKLLEGWGALGSWGLRHCVGLKSCNLLAQQLTRVVRLTG